MSVYQIEAVSKVICARVVVYECENCGQKNSYKQPYEKSFSKTGTSGKSQSEYKRLANRLRQEAFQEALREQKKLQAQKPDMPALGFEECPNCGYVQSWMIRGYRASRLAKIVAWPISLLGFGLLAATIVFSDGYYTENIDWWWGSVNQFVRCLVGLLTWVLLSVGIYYGGRILAQRIDPTANKERVGTINEPTTFWEEPRVV